MIKYVCKVCKKEFWDYKSEKRKYCSLQCRNTKTQEEKERHRKLMNKLWQNPEYRKHMSEVHKGYIMPEEQKRKIGLKSKQYKATKKTKRKISLSRMGIKNPMYGKKLSKIHREKISKALKGKYIGSKNSRWKGGKSITGYGYILLYMPNHPFANNKGYVRRSRFVMEEKLRRYLIPQEVVHHINENKTDDRPENLKLFSNTGKHSKYHQFIRI